MVITIFEVDPTLANPDDLKLHPDMAASSKEQFARAMAGPLTILPCAICYVPLTHVMTPEALASIESASGPAGEIPSKRDAILHRRFSEAQRLGQIEYIFDLGNWCNFFKPDPSNGKKYGTMLQILQYPFSRGSIHVRPPSSGAKATAADKPVIDPRYYVGNNGRLDLDVMVHCQRFAEEITRTRPLADIIRGRAFPPPELPDDGIRDWVTQTTVTDWHPVGTCAMGGDEGIVGGVIDERLRVYGVKRLRVVDASIMPLQISGHLQATVYAIAEKASQMILDDNESLREPRR